MELRAKQISPPKSWETFEDLCHALFKVVWNDPTAQKNGRSGQPQHGVDVFGGRNGDRVRYEGIQCKGKSAILNARPTVAELLEEVAKADSFEPALSHWTYVTTAPVDAAVQRVARELSVERAKAGKFTVDVLGWEELQALMATAPSVVKEFYPEAAWDLAALLDAVKRVAPTGPAPAAVWRKISFDGVRDLGPALMGRPLGPGDAAACPRLVEADQVVAQLTAAYSARVVGDPGAGKSICAWQAARSLGVTAWRLEDSQSVDVRLEAPDGDIGPALFIIDDAHLLKPGLLAHLESEAHEGARLLSIHNAVARDAGGRGAVVLDARRAVKTIAETLRRTPKETLAAVRKADDDVGDRMMSTSIERRIDEAVATASSPWQFCFILGGGWRRARQAVDRARAAGADHVLAVVSMRQIVSRDARATAADIADLCNGLGLDPGAIAKGLEWLVGERLLLSLEDCRTPHQRFAAVAMHQVLIGMEHSERPILYSVAANLLVDPEFPLLGLRNLLHEFHFGHGDYRWAWADPFDATTRRLIADRCFAAETPEAWGHAGLLLAELSAFGKDWAETIIAPKLDLLGVWMSSPGLGGYGLGWLHNHLWSGHKPLQLALTDKIDPDALAKAFSRASREETYGIADLIRSTRNGAADGWIGRFRSALDRDALLDSVLRWNEAGDAPLVAHACLGVMYYDEAFSLDLIEAYTPRLGALLAEDPVAIFSEVHDVAMFGLRIYDPLQAYVGKLAPDARRMMIGRRLCAPLDPVRVASQLSSAGFRDFQEAAALLSFLRKCSIGKFRAVVRAFDWTRLDATIGEAWRNPPHELEVILGVLYLGEGDDEPVAGFITRNLERLDVFPPRFALIAPKAALAHLSAGKRIALVKWHNVDWSFGGFVIELTFEERPNLLMALLEPALSGIAKEYERDHGLAYSEGRGFISTLALRAPDAMSEVLGLMDVEAAAQSWAEGLAKRGERARTVAVLVEAALGRSDAIGNLARDLRRRFPVGSCPPTERSALGRPRRRKRARKSQA